MKLKLVKFLAKLGVLGLLLGGTGTALLLSGCYVGLPPEPVYPWTVEPDPVPVENPGAVELDPVPVELDPAPVELDYERK